MSCNAWEEGTIKLPAAEAKKVRNVLKLGVTIRTGLLYDKAQEFWKALPAKAKRDRNEYYDAIQEFCYPDRLVRDLSEDLSTLLYKGWEHGATKARRIQQKDVQSVYGTPVGANPTFWIGDGSISFKGREVTYSVSDSHGCDRPREHPVSQMLWSALRQVNWTRGSGGEILGNNEYNEEAGRNQAGGGGSYVVMSFGPKSKNTRHQWGAGEVYYR
jgi:hypothetical protein